MLRGYNLVNDIGVGGVDYSNSSLSVAEMFLSTTLGIDDALDSPFKTITVIAFQLKVRDSLLKLISLKTPFLLFLIESSLEPSKEVELFFELRVLQFKILNLSL